MASARIFFSKKRHQRNGFIDEEVPVVVENGYEMQESDEDEVFVQNSNLEISASKPLMHPRNKSQRTSVKTRTIECRLYAVCKPLLYFFILVSVLCGIMTVIVYLANRHKGGHSGILKAADVTGSEKPVAAEKVVIVGCDKVEVEDVWVKGFPKLITESAFRLVDVNQDGILDVVFGFGTGADGFDVLPIVCDIYFGGAQPCGGGVMALDGQSGKELWRYYTMHEIFALNCQYDLDKDGVRDCLVAGRAGAFYALSCQKGSLLWEVEKSEAVNSVMNFYTAQYIADSNGDDIPDVIAINGGDPTQAAGSASRLSARILLVSGKTGEVLQWSGVPDRKESYDSVEILTRSDGSKVLLFGTGGETHNGSLWRVEVESLKRGLLMNRSQSIISDSHKGVMTPASLVDITGDGIEDIIVPMYNSTLVAINGDTFQPIWSNRFADSESYNTPAVGYYNDDNVPDFAIKYAYGNYPVYYYSQTTVIDGKTGKRLIDPPMRDTIGAQASPLAVHFEGTGNDVFLVWMADCIGHEGSKESYSFVKGTNEHAKSRANLCRLRFKTDLIATMNAMSQHLPRHGVPVYNSVHRKSEEHDAWVNTTAEAYDYLMNHPEVIDSYRSSMDTPHDHDHDHEWSHGDSEYQASQEAYDPQQYQDTHRIGSKKGPLSRGHDVNGRLPDRVSSNYLYRGGNPGYNSGRNTFSGNYFPSNDQRADDLNSNSYSPYKYGTNARGYYDNGYGSNYQGDGYERRRNGYNAKEGYPYNYRRTKKRRITNNGGDRKMRFMDRKRRKRHVGSHDDGGYQRLLSTGMLAPTLLPPGHKDYSNTIDLVFATYWFYPVHTKAILPEDAKCISDRLAQEAVATMDAESEFYQMDHSEYEQAITELCLKKSDHQLHDHGQFRDMHSNNPFKLKMGQMTVYRLRLKFSCSQSGNWTDTEKKCANVLPYSQQKWAAYMGSNGDGYWSIPDLPTRKSKT